MPDIYEVIKRPLITESAVEKLFSVKVLSVNTARVHGKWRRHGRATAQRPDWKKAFVKLEAGNSIELF
jgi:large subunit ribosomal protein L23